MKSIMNVSLTRAHNSEFLLFHSDVLGVLTTELAEANHFGPWRATYESLYTKADSISVVNPAYASTEDIEAKDAKRDNSFAFVRNVVDNSQFSPAEAEREAGRILIYVIDPYRKSATKSYADNTREMRNLVAKLQSEEYAPYVETLGLTAAVEALGAANEDFHTTYSGRTAEKYDRVSTETMKQLRPQIIQAMLLCFSAVNAFYLVNELTEQDSAVHQQLGGAIDLINGFIVQLQETMSRRTGEGGPNVEPDDDTLPEGGTTPDEGGTTPDEGGETPTPPPGDDDDEEVVG